MRAATAVGATAILILVTEVWACTAGAEDAIEPGKWEFWTVGSKIPEPPPGTQLPPSVRWGPEGMITSVCISSETNLKTPHSRTRTSVPRHGDFLPALKTRLGKGSCDLDTTTDATTATRSLSMNCAWSSGSKSNTEGVMHFHGHTRRDDDEPLQLPQSPDERIFIPHKGSLCRPVRPRVSRGSGRKVIADNATRGWPLSARPRRALRCRLG
jgi:hypothetical protein